MLAALAARAAEDPHARAVRSASGPWLTRAGLLDLALSGALSGSRASAQTGTEVRLVADADPLTTLAQLLAAQADGAVPVLADPAWPQLADPTWPGSVGAAVAGRGATPGGRPEPVIVVLTSGSSAHPRAVVRSAASWAVSLDAFTAAVGLERDDVVWAPGGLTSTLTLFAAWHALAVGLPVVLTGAWRSGAVRPDPEVTVVQGVPSVVQEVLHRPAAWPRLRRVVVAGSAGTDRVRRAAADTGVAVVEYYGAAELSFVALDPDGAGLRPFPGCEIEVRGTGDGAHAGVIWVRSPYLAMGYLHPDRSAPLRLDGAWASVGDRGRLSADGVLRVDGRGGEAVSVGGYTVVAADVEAVLAMVPGVLEAVCLGEAHSGLGERVIAALRLSPEAAADPAAVRATLALARALARERLPAAARPVRYAVLPELPRTSGGKVARAVLRAQVRAGGPGGSGATGADQPG